MKPMYLLLCVALLATNTAYAKDATTSTVGAETPKSSAAQNKHRTKKSTAENKGTKPEESRTEVVILEPAKPDPNDSLNETRTITIR